MGQGISGRQLARSWGRTENAVRKAEKAGKIRRLPDGSFDEAESLRRLRASTDPARAPEPKGAQPVRDPGARPVRDPGARPARPVVTPDDARDAVRLVEQVLAEEGASVEGPIDFPAARLAETILKARDRALRIAERRKVLVPLEAVKRHIAAAFVGLRRAIQAMPSRHVPEMAARLGVDPGVLQVELDRMVAATLGEMSEPVARA